MIQQKRKNIPVVVTEIPDYDSCGIYALVDEKGKRYVGSSIHVKTRIIFHKTHLSFVKRGWGSGHVNKKMADAVKQGVVLKAELLEKVADESLLWKREQYYINKFGGLENTYNEVMIPRKNYGKKTIRVKKTVSAHYQ